MLGKIYSGYLKSLAAIGHACDWVWHRKHGHVSVEEVGEAIDHDQRATALGNRYRGMGVVVGALGALIVLCALLPYAVEIDAAKKYVVSAELILIILMVGIVVYGYRSGTHRHWLYHRRAAEKQRYAALTEQLRNNVNGTEINIVLKDILLGQIRYNSEKSDQYGAIELFSEYFSWGGVVVAIVATLIELRHEFLGIESHWLIFFTVLGPALVGAVHGINGFLRIQDLAEDHAKMAMRLQELLDKLTTIPSGAHAEVFEIAEMVHKLLSDRDDQWEEMAQRLGLKVG